MKKLLTFLCISTFLLLFVGTTHALTIYDSLTDWESAVGSYLTEDFNSVPSGFPSVGLNNAGLIDIRINGGVGFCEFTGSDFVGDTRSHEGQTQDIIFPFPVFAFGADWTDTLSNSLLTNIIGGETVKFSDHLTGYGDGFLGFVFDSPLSEIRISDEGLSGNEWYAVDNVRFSASAPVPEPATMLLLGTGLVCLAGFGRKKFFKK